MHVYDRKIVCKKKEKTAIKKTIFKYYKQCLKLCILQFETKNEQLSRFMNLSLQQHYNSLLFVPKQGANFLHF